MNKHPSMHLTPSGAATARSELSRINYAIKSPAFSFEVTKELYGERSAIFQSMLQSEGPDGNIWSRFGWGCSPDNLGRFFYGLPLSSEVFIASYKTTLRLTGLPSLAIAADPAPQFEQIYQSNLAEVATAKANLERGITIDESRTPFGSLYFNGNPVLNSKVEDVFCLPVRGRSGASCDDLEIMASVCGTNVPVGRILTFGSKVSILYRPTPYVWCGEEVVVGRKKKVRLVKIAAQRLQTCIQTALTNHFIYSTTIAS